MQEAFYIERSPLGTRVFNIDGFVLEFSTRLGDRRVKSKVDLRRVDACFEARFDRFYFGLVASFVLFAACIILSRWILSQNVLPQQLVIWTSGLAGIFGWFGYKCALLYKSVRLRDKSGRQLLEIYENKKQPADFEAFINALEMRINELQLGTGNVLPRNNPV